MPAGLITRTAMIANWTNAMIGIRLRYWFAPPSSELRSCLTALIGMANPTPTLPAMGLSIEQLTPITWPNVFSRAPPELPGLIGASVWIKPVTHDDWLLRF